MTPRLAPTVPASDPDGLGLLASCFEYGLAPGFDPSTLPVDAEPFDPDAEAQRFAQIAFQVSYETYGGPRKRWAFHEPVFTALPSRERAAWWLAQLGSEHAVQRPRMLHDLLVLASQGMTALLGPDFDQNVPVWSMCRLRVFRNLLTPDDLATLREYADRPLVPGARHQEDPELWCAYVLGERDEEIAALVRDAEALPALYACCLPTLDQRVTWAREKKVELGHVTGSTDWAWLVGVAGLPWIQADLDACVGRGQTEGELVPFALTAHGPAVVPMILDQIDGAAATWASRWVRDHLESVVKARLTPRQQDRAALFLRAEPDRLPEATTPAMRSLLDDLAAERELPTFDPATGWWAEQAAGLEPLTLPEPMDAAALPPLLIDGARLAPTEVGVLLAALSESEQHPLVPQVIDHADGLAMDRFAVALLLLWLSARAPRKENWMMVGAGYLGNSEFVHLLTRYVREWPGQAQHQRAVTGLVALAAVATEESLAAIAGIAAKSKFKAIQERADEAMAAIAEELGLSRDELEDRIIPDGGLDEQGRRTFDFGARRFVAYLTPDAKVLLRELDADGRPTGKPKTTLPKPNKSDDAEPAAAAKAEFTAMKKSLTASAKAQVARFEQAMIRGRRWTPEEHATYIRPQPLLRGLLNGVIWGVYDDGQLVATARIDEDTTLVDADDRPVSVAAGQTIGVAHPIELSAQTLARWGEVLADFELRPPFQHLDRTVFALPADQGDDPDLHDLPTNPIPAGTLIGAFNRYNWQRGDVLDNGVYRVHAQQFPDAGVTALCVYADGLWMGSPAEMDDQRIERVRLVDGVYHATHFGWGHRSELTGFQGASWQRLSPAVVSEVLAMIHQAAG